MVLQTLSRRAAPGFDIREVLRQVWSPIAATPVIGDAVLATSRALDELSSVMRLPAEVDVVVIS